MPGSTLAFASRSGRSAAWGGAIALGVLIILAAACVVGPTLSPYRFDEQHPGHSLEAPGLRFPCGTDLKGRDLLVRLLRGGQVSLQVGLLCALVSTTIGLVWGAVSGWAGGRTDAVMMRTVDVLNSLPRMFLVIVLMTVVGRSRVVLFVAIGCFNWYTMARIVRMQARGLRRREFVLAALAAGAGSLRILRVHIVRNLVGPVIAYAALLVPQAMLQEAFLSFLGLGVQPPDASWGTLVADGLAAVNPIHTYWWLIALPGGAMVLVLVCLNHLGDRLRERWDPRLRRGV